MTVDQLVSISDLAEAVRAYCQERHYEAAVTPMEKALAHYDRTCGALEADGQPFELVNVDELIHCVQRRMHEA